MGRLLDSTLDRGLIGYTTIGYQVRRRTNWPADPAAGSLAGKLAIVTGGSAGIGKATAAGLMSLGARVHIVVRDRERGEAAAAELARHAVGGDVRVDVCDVSSMRSVEKYAASFPGPLDVLIHNAGVMPPERAESVDGYEMGLATHVLGPHLLTRLLTPAMEAAGAARVIWVTSGGMYAHRLDPDELDSAPATYRPAAVYARTKRMQVALADEWARRQAAGPETVVNSMHPGWADTPGVAASLPTFRRLLGPSIRTPEQGADTVVWLAAAPEGGQVSGELWHDRMRRTKHYLPWTRETAADRKRLFDICDDLTGPAELSELSAVRATSGSDNSRRS
ncbi:MAG: SDR family NAD(P)-dependent oxidoreductase [Frankiaceae bacterium]|nr:SDR family NAD(P)-dependent oxidoreductase [Frankiaceae bacterium]MBV9872951.1 SDR family NAD(P)-dependent oxidoreductase [Frankiaceae bacterium]